MNQPHIARKRFGQHFLKDNHVIEKIVHALQIQPHDNLVEIGAGTGALTSRVIHQIPHLHIVEIDRDLVAQLRTDYTEKQITVYEGDALDFNFASLCTTPTPTLRVFGNLPYNISTPILFHLLSFSHCIQDMLFMLQKEVIERMCATPSHHAYGRLSVMIQYACATEMLFDIGPGAFSPPPKVMSSVIRLKPYAGNSPHPVAHDFKTFANIVNVAFQHRRKTLKNSLQTLVSPALFEIANIDPIRRPETLSIAEYVHLSNIFVEHQKNL